MRLNKSELKLVSILVALSIIPLFGLMYLNNSETLKTAKETTQNELQESIRLKAEVLDNFLALLKEQAGYIASMKSIINLASSAQGSKIEHNNDYEKIHSYLQNVQDSHWGKNHHIFLTDVEGNVFLSPNHNKPGSSGHLKANISEHPFFERSLKTTQITDFFSFSEASHYHQLLMQPIKNEAKTTVGVLVIEVCIDYVKMMLSNDFTIGGKEANIFISTLDKQAVVHSKEEEILSLDSKGLDEALANQSASGEYLIGENYILGSYLKDPKWDWVIAAEIDRLKAYEAAREKLKKSIIQSLTLQGIAIIFIFITVAIFVKKLIITPIKNIVVDLNYNVDNVNGFASIVSQTSKTIANGTGSQAANLEEIASTIEQFAATCRTNFESSKNANSIMTDHNASTKESLSEINTISSEMTIINSESEKMSSIIKTIDDIAFQTNLLALNAAVEAARAGEAGAGFAVVADEVRNLALRAADAAKDTQDLIDSNVKNVSKTAKKVEVLSEDIENMHTHANKTAQILNEITISVAEQNDQVVQINKAINALDVDTQKNAGNADESAQSALKLQNQSQSAKQTIHKLGKLVGLLTEKIIQKNIQIVNEPLANEISPDQLVILDKKEIKIK